MALEARVKILESAAAVGNDPRDASLRKYGSLVLILKPGEKAPSDFRGLVLQTGQYATAAADAADNDELSD